MAGSSADVAASDRETVDSPAVALTRTRPLRGRTRPSDDPPRIGRYTVRRRLGVGGMSVVYEALDERIGRAVALKLMLVGDASSDRERLRREAQALARLSHPHVVEVFEIGEHDERPYVAMALVEGHALDRWLRLRRRSPAEIVEVFIQAGEGLAAAHAQGLVHRDFKPGNVLVGSDGRVRVVDFGLVRESEAVEPASSADSRSRASLTAEISGGSLPSASWKESLTKTGAMVGTPAYMSPEQLGGLAAGPASDQFAFCVALFEALYGQHPFVFDGNWQQLPYNVLEGRVQRPTHERRVPAALGKLVMRGLALRPEDRWPAMDVLLPQLRRALDRRRPRLGSSVLAVGVAALGLGALHRTAQVPVSDPCGDGAAVMRTVWSPEARDDLRHTWLATSLPGAADTWTRVDSRLQAYADDWWAIHGAACAGPAHAVSSATCLARMADGLGTHLDVMARPNESLLYNAVGMVDQLPSLDRCSTALDAPSDAAVDELPPWQGELDQVDALLSAGQNEQVSPLIDDLLVRAGSEHNARLTAEANLRLGRLLMANAEVEPAAATFEEAYLGAKPLGLDRLAAESALALLQLFGEVRYRSNEAKLWVNHARAETERVGDPLLTSRYLNGAGRALRGGKELEKALELHQQALALLRSLPTDQPIERSISHFQIGTVLGLMKRGDEARQHLEEALHIQEQSLGLRHPRVALTLTNIGIFLMMEGRDQPALAKLELAYDIIREISPDSPGPGTFQLVFMAGIRAREGRVEEAIRDLRTYIDRYQRSREPEDMDLAHVELTSCELAQHERAYEEALGHCRQALAEVELGSQEVHASTVHSVMAMVLIEKGELDEAVAAQRRAHALMGDKLQPEGPSMSPQEIRHVEAEADHALGRVLAMAGQHDEALIMLERARAGLGGKGGADWRLHEVELDLGNALMALGRAAEARPGLQAALPVIEARTGPQSMGFVRALVAAAEVELVGGDVAVAREQAERASRLLEGRTGFEVELLAAQAHFAVARSLGSSRRERAQAVALARQAEQALAARGEVARRRLQAVRGWLSERGARSPA
jgi:tetratricopeptide (TPR) repeat protein